MSKPTSPSVDSRRMYRELGVSRLMRVRDGFFTEFLRTIEKRVL